MHRGEQFELECFKYLVENYGNAKTQFIHHFTCDSTGSDIEVKINNKSVFFIEVKDTVAQSGQFVVLPNNVSHTFEFSPNNKSSSNEITDLIINHLNKNFEKYNNAGTAGKKIDIDSNFFAQWIINHYKNKKVKYVISKKENFLICPIDKFEEYFEIESTLRVKKSGSSHVPKKDVEMIKLSLLQENFNLKTYYEITESGKKRLLVKAPSEYETRRFTIDNSTYYFSPTDDKNLFEIKKLSNTRNKNVIFSIKVKQEQVISDLEKFNSEFYKVSSQN